MTRLDEIKSRLKAAYSHASYDNPLPDLAYLIGWVEAMEGALKHIKTMDCKGCASVARETLAGMDWKEGD
jgi:hypothetical protein